MNRGKNKGSWGEEGDVGRQVAGGDIPQLQDRSPHKR